MEIKKLQLCMAVALGTLAMLIGICQLTASSIVLSLIDRASE